jgi:hypothetical protein
MTENSAAPKPANAPADPEKARAEFLELLTTAVYCALLAAGLQVAGGLLELNEGFNPGRFTWSMGLTLGAILPQGLVAAGFWEIGEKTKARGLRASSMGSFLCLWAVAVVGLASEDFLPIWLRVVLFILAVFLAIVILGMLDETFPNVKTDYPTPVVIGCLFLLAVGFGSALWLKMPVNKVTVVLAAVALGAGLVLLVGLLVFPVWCSIALIRGREQLGSAALVLGLVQLLGWLGTLTLIVMIAVNVVNFMNGQAGWNEQALAQAVEPLQRFAAPSMLVFEGLWGLLLAVFFLGVRSRAAEWPLNESGDSPPPAATP